MAYTIVQHPVGSNATGAALSVPKSGPAAGNLLIASCEFKGSVAATALNITDNSSGGAAWTFVSHTFAATANFSVWYKFANAADLSTLTSVTFTPTGGTLTSARVKCDEISGFNAGAYLDLSTSFNKVSSATAAALYAGAPNLGGASEIAFCYGVFSFATNTTAQSAAASSTHMGTVTAIDTTGTTAISSWWAPSSGVLTTSDGFTASWTTNSVTKNEVLVFYNPQTLAAAATGVSTTVGAADETALLTPLAAGTSTTVGQGDITAIVAPIAAGAAGTLGAAVQTATLEPVSSGAASTIGTATDTAKLVVTANGVSNAIGTATQTAKLVLAAVGVSNTIGTASEAYILQLLAAGISTAVGAAVIGTLQAESANGLSSTIGSATMTALLALAANGAANTVGEAAFFTQTYPLSASGSANSAGSAIFTPLVLSANGASHAIGTATQDVLLQLFASGTATTFGTASVALKIAFSANGHAHSIGACIVTGQFSGAVFTVTPDLLGNWRITESERGWPTTTEQPGWSVKELS